MKLRSQFKYLQEFDCSLYEDKLLRDTLVDPFCSCFRWEVIANYMNLHSTTGMKRTAKDVINKAKSLQKLGIYITLFL